MNRRIFLRVRIASAGACFAVTLLLYSNAVPVSAQTSENHALIKSALSQGGVVSSSPNYTVRDAIGQSGAAGMMASSGYTFSSGFFSTMLFETGVEENTEAGNSRMFRLAQNYPNPFNPKTTIQFSVGEKCRVRLRVYTVQGALAAEVIDKDFAPGLHNVVFDGSALSSGVYLYLLEAGDVTEVKRMLLIK